MREIPVYVCLSRDNGLERMRRTGSTLVEDYGGLDVRDG